MARQVRAQPCRALEAQWDIALLGETKSQGQSVTAIVMGLLEMLGKIRPQGGKSGAEDGTLGKNGSREGGGEWRDFCRTDRSLLMDLI